jgi:hypothetical protein
MIQAHGLHCLPICLVDDQLQFAGILYLNLPDSQGAPESFTCDLVAISAGWIKDDDYSREWWLTEWSCPERPKSGDLYEFYNVMWVEWHNGIAYRKAIGRVWKEAWERQDLEWLDVKLG